MTSQEEWPEPIIRVQSLAESGISTVPSRYIKPELQRPISEPAVADDIDIPFIDLSELMMMITGDINDCAAAGNETNMDGRDHQLRKKATMEKVSEACREWGFFQVVNHGVKPELMDRARQVWREFFHLPMEAKQRYSNSPKTYEGYGSRLGVEKGAILDWSDYYFLHYLPPMYKDHNKWPAQPLPHREVMEEYLGEVAKLGERLMKILSINLGLEDHKLEDAFGGSGDAIGVCLRANFYPKCPQPNLTLGLSPHSDPGGMTILLPDPQVSGLQVQKDGKWVTVKPAHHAFIINIGDQLQILSNAIYKSVEHRVTVNPNVERISLACFYNPRGDQLIEPVKDLIAPDKPALYNPMTFSEYRLFIRKKGLHGKAQVESLKSPR